MIWTFSAPQAIFLSEISSNHANSSLRGITKTMFLKKINLEIPFLVENNEIFDFSRVNSRCGACFKNHVFWHFEEKIQNGL